MIVHRHAFQVYLLLSIIYQPQNQFCIAVDRNSNNLFWKDILLLQKCYRNIHVVKANPIRWCDYSILDAMTSCLDHLTKSPVPWKYYQYLAGVDGILKTNLEMVRIMKALNGRANVEVLDLEKYRLWQKSFMGKSEPLPLYKSSMSAIIPRDTADFISKDMKMRELRVFLNGTLCPDESLWATVLAHPRAPNSFNAEKFLAGRDSKWARELYGSQWYIWHRWPTMRSLSSHSNKTFHVDNYFIGRYQQWITIKPGKCKGKFVRLSCVYGVGDLSVLIRRPETLAHKLYLDYEPAALLCLTQEIRRRTEGPVDFDALQYKKLPNSPYSIE